MPSSTDDEDAQQQQQSGCKRPHASSELWEFESLIAAEPPKSKVVLGVDGGGTCTVCVCVAAPVVVPRDGSLPLLSRCVTASSNHNSVGVARRAIEESMAGALMKARIPRSAVQAVCLALAGVDSPSDGEAYLSWMRKIFPSTVEMAVHNDGVAALASGTAGKLYGCVLIAGTGTIALGFGEDGKFARASGVGPALGDQGSGFAIASQALAAIMRADDGRGPATSLTPAILKTLGLSLPQDLIGWVYADAAWARVASLLPVVKACAREGDTVARKVLDDAVYELSCSVKAVVTRLKLNGNDGMKTFPLVLAGGVLENDDGWDLCKPLMECVAEMFPRVQPIRPTVEPAIGAAMLAWTQCQTSVTEENF
ncbi:hypothetical protein CY35_02G176300 [Sphagnum magellanicum]|nr:hypothetical protein CY35_02G176300 [Sphagnum magellanicum]